MTIPYVNETTPCSFIGTTYIPVEPGKTYTYAMYAKADFGFSGFVMYYARYDANKLGLGNGSGFVATIPNGNEWQENVFFVTPDANTHFIALKLIRGGLPNIAGNIWLDNIYFGEGVGFEQPPTPKVPFRGTGTRVDELGNVEINKWA